MNNTVTKQVDRTDREQYLEACRSYAAATSPMDGLALAQLAIAAIFAGMQIGEQNAMTAQMSYRICRTNPLPSWKRALRRSMPLT